MPRRNNWTVSVLGFIFMIFCCCFVFVFSPLFVLAVNLPFFSLFCVCLCACVCLHVYMHVCMPVHHVNHVS